MSKAGWGFGFSYGSGGFKPFCGFTRVGLTGFYLEGHRGLGVLLLFGFRILKGLGLCGPGQRRSSVVLQGFMALGGEGVQWFADGGFLSVGLEFCWRLGCGVCVALLFGLQLTGSKKQLGRSRIASCFLHEVGLASQL